MKKSDLVQALAQKAQIPASRAKQVVDTVFSAMTDELSDGGKIEIRGFASFKVKNYGSYVGRNPKTGDSVNVAPKKGLVFKVGRELREYLKTKANS